MTATNKPNHKEISPFGTPSQIKDNLRFSTSRKRNPSLSLHPRSMSRSIFDGLDQAIGRLTGPTLSLSAPQPSRYVR